MQLDEIRQPHKSPFACLREDREERILKNARRAWDRQPTLRAEYGGSFEKYQRSLRDITYG